MKKYIPTLIVFLALNLHAQIEQSASKIENNSMHTYEEIKNKFRTKWDNYSEAQKQANQRELKKFGRFSWFWDSRIMPDQTFEEYQTLKAKSYKKSQNLLEYELDFDGDNSSGIWKPMGPNNHTGPSDGHLGGVGRIKDLAFHPWYHGQFYNYGEEPPSVGHNTIYAGGGIGGLWISKNGGQNWENMNTDFLPNLSVKGIAQWSLNYNEMYFGASSNDLYTESIKHNSMIVYRTLDHGITWEACGAPFDDEDLNDNLALNDIIIHPKSWYSKDGDPAENIKSSDQVSSTRDPAPDSYAVLVAAENGIYRSNDKGASWTHTWNNTFDGIPYYTKGPVKMHIPPTSLHEMYITGYMNQDDQGPDHSVPNIYKSNNYGASWNVNPWISIDVGQDNGNPQNNTIYIDFNESHPNFGDFKIIGTNMAISHQNSDKLFVLVNVYYQGFTEDIEINGLSFSTGAKERSRQFLYYSLNGGITWTNTLFGSNQFNSDFKNANCFMIDPLDDTRLYFARIHGSTADVFIIRDNNGSNQVASQHGTSIGMHPDPRSLVFHKEHETEEITLICGTDGGINITENPEDNNPSWLNITGSDLAVGQIYRHASAQTDNNIVVAGFQDIGSNLRDSNSSYSWNFASGQDGMDCAIDPTNHNLFMTSSQDGNGPIIFVNGILSSNNKPFNAGVGFWVSPMAFSEGDPDKFYMAWKDLWVHPNKALNSTDWVKLTDEVLDNIDYSDDFKFITVFDISKTNPDHIIFAVYGHYSPANRLYKSINGGTDWTPMPTYDANGFLLTQNGWISDIEFDPKDENRICVSFAGYSQSPRVYRTLNGGISWFDWHNGLPEGGVNCLETDEKTDFIYAGTDYGVYRRKSNEYTWLKYGSGLPNVIVTDLDLQLNAHQIRASTYGRGLWYSDLAKAQTSKDKLRSASAEDDVNNIIISPNPTDAQLFTSFKLTEHGYVDIAIIDHVNGAEVIKVLENFLLPEGKHRYEVDVSNLKRGIHYISYHFNGERTIKPFMKL